MQTNNEYKELTVEVKNRITSKANMAYGNSKLPMVWHAVQHNKCLSSKDWQIVKQEFIDQVETLEARIYQNTERAKDAQAELMQEYEEKLAQKEKAYQEIMRENARLLTKLQNVHAPNK